MALTFPRDLPDIGIRASSFELGRTMSVNRQRGGTVEVVEQADALWSASFEFIPRNRRQEQQVRSWFNSMQGGLQDFVSFNPKHPYPALFPSGFTGVNRAAGGTFDGSAVVDAISANSLTISTLPADFSLVEGDLVGLVQSGEYGLHMIVEDATGNSSGIVSVTVEPAIRLSLFDTTATVEFAKPKCRMMILQDTRSGAQGNVHQPFSFQAIQKLF